MAIALAVTLVAIAVLVQGGAAASCYDQSPFDQADWPHCASPSSKVFVFAGKTHDGRFMKLGMRAMSTGGWTALAVASNGGMKGAREIVVRKDSSQQWIVEDRYSQAYATPSLASEQHVQLLFVEEIGGATSWGVLLPINPCTGEVNGYPTNVDLSKDVHRFMLWALGSSHAFSYHSRKRGTFTFNFMSGPKQLPSTTGLQHIRVTMPNVDVVVAPGGQDPTNPYICTIFDLSRMTSLNMSQKHHVAKFSPIVNLASKQYVHHMVLFRCHPGPTWKHEHLDVIPDCTGMPKGCDILTWPWAVGSKEIVYPNDAGMPMGERLTWYVLQMHYYNPNLVPGVKDSSGVDISISTALRQHDVGVFQLNGGTTSGQRDPLPPGLRQSLIFQVPSSCTSRLTREVTVMGAFHHAHKLGTYLNIDVIRNGRHVGRLLEENFYDFNHQTLGDPVVKTLRPGDTLTMNCTWDTTRATNLTPFGDLTQEEMCYAVVFIYPDEPLITKNAGAFFMKGAIAGQKWLWQHASLLSPYCSTNGKQADFANVSSCAEALTLDPLKFADWKGWPIGNEAASICNFGLKLTGANVTPSLFTQSLWPGFCPACWRTQSCTRAALTAHAQQNQCPSICDDRWLSTWPDNSRLAQRFLLNHTDMMECGNSKRPLFYTPVLNYSKLSCQKLGALASANATSAAVKQCFSCQPFASIYSSFTMQLSSPIAVVHDALFQTNVKSGIASEFGVVASLIKMTLAVRVSGHVHIIYIIRIPISNASMVQAAMSKDPTVVALTSAIQTKLDTTYGTIAVLTKTSPTFHVAHRVTTSTTTSAHLTGLSTTTIKLTTTNSWRTLNIGSVSSSQGNVASALVILVVLIR